MKKNLISVLLLLTIFTSCQHALKENTPIALEKPLANMLSIGTKHVFASKILEEDRPIIVSLPVGYEESDANYPVLVLLDGLQNIWHTKGTIEILTRTGSMPPVIIVGIESTDRMRDLSPTSSVNNPGSGRGPKFLKFIQDELMPYVDSNYRTHPFRILEGHSMGGLFTTYALMDKPELFDAHIIMSPALWWNEEEMAKKAKLFFKSNPALEKTIFFGIGSNDGYGMRQELIRFVDVIQQNQPEGLRWKHKEFDGEGHMSAPLLINYEGLKFIFSDMKFPEELMNTYSDEAFLKHEKKIMNKYGRQAKQSAEAYVMLAFKLMEKNNLPSAITVIKRSVEAYSFDVNLLNLLANTYEKNSDIENAIRSFKEAIEISKKYKFAREDEFQVHIKRLENN